MRKVSRWCWVVGVMGMMAVAGGVGGVGGAGGVTPVHAAVLMQTPAAAQTTKREILWPAGATQQWQSVRDLLKRMADKMPAEYYSFRPTPEMKPFAATLAHVVSSNVNTCSNLLGRTHALTAKPLDTTLTQKAELVAALQSTSAFCDEYFAKLTTGAQLSDSFYETSFVREGTKTEVKAAHGVLVSSLIGHANEVYGYMAVYLRLKGIVPPSSERAAPAPANPAAAPATAADVLAKAVNAMGGEATLKAVRTMALEAMGHQWALEQSERPEGPWLSTYMQRSEVRDIAGNRRTASVQRRDWNFPAWSAAAVTVIANNVSARRNGQRWFGGSPADVRDWNQSLALGPERLLLTARSAADLRLLPDEVHQGVNHRVVGFTFDGQAHRLALNVWTSLPTMLEIVRDDPMWGDVTERRWFSFWTMEAGGLMYPRQTTTEWNGLPFSDWTVHDVKVNVALDESTFQIPDEAAKAFATTATRPTGMNALTLDENRVTMVTDWITQVPGGFNIGFVRQPDGIVIFEATTTSKYSASILALAEKRHPGVPIKAVVTTSDAWPHLAGIREYVAKGIPIYALDLNVPILSRLIAAPRTISPDTLAQTPQAPKFVPVSARTTIGTGDTRIELIPVRGEMGERMMLAWFPGAKLLYSSDLIQPGRAAGTFFMPMMLAEVASAAERENLGVIERVFGMHLPPTPWDAVTAAIAAARR